MAAWVNPSSLPGSGRINLVGSDAASRDWSIGINDGNYVAFYRNAQLLDSGVAASADVWTHVAATLNGNMLQIYTDGVARASVDIGVAYAPSVSGTRIGSTTFNSAGFFAGRIDEVSIIERGVSDAEIVTLRDSGSIETRPDRDRLLVVFDRPIDSDSVAAGDASFSGPSAVAVESSEVIGDRSVLVVLDGPLAMSGDHTLSIGPNILGTSGTAMDQDGDGIAGENPDDVFSGSFSVDLSGPRIVSQSPDGIVSSVLTSMEVTFNEPVDPASLTPAAMRLLDPEMKAAADAFDPNQIVEGFRVNTVASRVAFTDVESAENVIADAAHQSQAVWQSVPTINYGTSAGNFPADRLVPAVASDYFVLEATATITIPSPGPWTFAIGSDDGYRLEIDSFSAEFPTTRGFATDVATFDFPAAGDFPIRLLLFESTGGHGFELSAAAGVKTEFDGDFKLVGDTTAGGLRVVSPAVAPQDSIRILSVTPSDQTNQTFRITFAPQPADGDYELTIAPAALDVAGNRMDQDNDGTGGEPDDDRYISTITVDRDPLRVVSQSPVGSVSEAIEAIEVTFNVPIDPSSFATSDAKLIGPGGQVAVTNVDRITDTRYRITFERATEDGEYQLFVGPDITDPAGIAMDTDGDAIVGELEDRYAGALTLNGAGPFVAGFTPEGQVAAPMDRLDVTFSEPVRLTSFTAGDVSIVGPDGGIAVLGIESSGDRTYSISIPPQTTGGEYNVVIGPDIDDFGGTSMDQDRDGTPGEASQDAFSTTLTIDAGGPRVIATDPTGTVSAAFSFIDVTFSEEIDLPSFTLDDVSLIGPSGEISISQIVDRDMNVVRLRFSSQSALGDYLLSVGPAITDTLGNLMDQDGDGIFGEAVEDVFTTTIRLDTADLAFEDVTIPSVARNGDEISVAWSVRNSGSALASAPWIDRAVLSRDEFFGNRDDVLLGTFSVTSDLDASTTYSASVTGTIPFGIEGNYRVFVQSDAGHTLTESDETNNLTQRPITIEFARPPADLIVDALSTPSSASIGNAIPVTWRVRNDGTAATPSGSWVDRVYLSTDTTIGGDLLLGSFSHEGVLSADASYTMTASPVIPASVGVGDYYVLVQTDATNQLEEAAAEDNNVAVSDLVSVQLAPLPDLLIDSVVPVSGQTATSGEPLTLQWTTRNDGDADAGAPWTDRVYLSSDATLSPDDPLLGQLQNEAPISAGSSATSSLSVTLPEEISGDYFLIVVPDADNDCA